MWGIQQQAKKALLRYTQNKCSEYWDGIISDNMEGLGQIFKFLVIKGAWILVDLPPGDLVAEGVYLKK